MNDLVKLSSEVADLLKNIANPIRLMVLCNLLNKDMTVSDLLECIDISQSALSQHLTILREKNIIKDTKSRKYVYYSISDVKTKQILGFLHQICCNK
jgi:DNA-binding transcriptional ArsR family regulator